MHLKHLVLVFAILFGYVYSEETTPTKSDKSDFKRSLSKNCANSYSATCMKLDIVSWVDKLNEAEDFSVLPGVSVVKEDVTGRANTADIVAELAREFPNDPEARLDAYLLKKISGYLGTHSIRLNFMDTQSAVTGRKGGGIGGKGGKKGGMGMMLLAAGAMMKSTLMTVAMGALAALAGKALMTALISLMLSGIIGLKSLSGGGGKATTYEIVSKPVYSHSNTHSSGHDEHGGYSSYGRSFDMPLPLGLQPGYKP